MTPSDTGQAPVLRVSVVVPSYRRPELLRTCLQALGAQLRPADEVVVVRREDDAATASVVSEFEGAVREALVHEPGVIAAMRCGAVASLGDVVVFTDDDAAARPEWLATLVKHYDDPDVGGVGGRDVVEGNTDPTVPSMIVGQLGAWGRLSGHHHQGTGTPTRVDVLKGVNMSWRREALALPTALHGSGAQVHNEVAICLRARSQGWTLVYDPLAVVDHRPGQRFDDDRRSRPSAQAVFNEAYNLVWAIVGQRRDLFARRAAYGLFVGDSGSPGLLRAGVAALRADLGTLRRFLPSIAGQVQALADLAAGRLPELVPVGPLPPGRPDDR